MEIRLISPNIHIYDHYSEKSVKWFYFCLQTKLRIPYNLERSSNADQNTSFDENFLYFKTFYLF